MVMALLKKQRLSAYNTNDTNPVFCCSFFIAIGNASIAEKAFRNYKYEGETYDLCVNDFELIANATQSHASTDLNKLQIDSNSDNAIFTKVSLNSSAGILETYTCLTYPSMLNLNHGNSIFFHVFASKI